MNVQDWWIILIGLLAAAICGSIFPAFAFIFGNASGVFSKPHNVVLRNIHPWAIAFITVGLISAIFNIIKVSCSYCGNAV